MKVDKIITPIVENTTKKVVQKAEQVATNTVKEFNDKAGDIVGRTQVLQSKGLSVAEQRKALIDKMHERNFSQSTIDYILGYSRESWNVKVAREMVNDEYAHTSDIRWAIGYTTKENANLMLDAARKKNYEAFYQIKSGIITDTSQIEDLSEKVVKEGRKYTPKRKVDLPAVNPEELTKSKNEILNLVKAKGGSNDAINYLKSYINAENVEVASVLANDKNASVEFMRWVIPYTNGENAEHMLRAVLNKDYNAVYSIQNGRLREFDTLDARYALLKRLDKANTNSLKNKIQELFYFANDDISSATKILFEDTSFDEEFIKRVATKINKGNVKEFKKALINKDWDLLSKLCGEKFNCKELGFATKVNNEFKATSSTGRITRSDFVRYMNDKLAHIDKFDVATLKDSEVRNLAKLLGTTEEQILNMDKKEYRRLCLKTHPDKNPDDSMATQVFRILNRLFLG